MVAWTDSLYSLKPLRALIEKNLSLSALQESGRDFVIGTVSLVSGRYAEWTPQDNGFMERLSASASIPVVFPAADLKQERDVIVDGGVRNGRLLPGAFASARPTRLAIRSAWKRVSSCPSAS